MLRLASKEIGLKFPHVSIAPHLKRGMTCATFIDDGKSICSNFSITKVVSGIEMICLLEIKRFVVKCVFHKILPNLEL